MKGTLSKERRGKTILTVVLTVISVIYVLPVFMVLLNSFKRTPSSKQTPSLSPQAKCGRGFPILSKA